MRQAIRDNAEQIKILTSKINSIEKSTQKLTEHTEHMNSVMVDIAVALEKISTIEREIRRDQTDMSTVENKVNDIENRLPAIEQTVQWVNKAIIGLVSLLVTVIVGFIFASFK